MRAWTIGLIGIAAMTASGQPFQIESSTIDGGGGTLVGAAYELTGTVGQPDAGVSLAGSTFAISGGFWTTAGMGAARSASTRRGRRWNLLWPPARRGWSI